MAPLPAGEGREPANPLPSQREMALLRQGTSQADSARRVYSCRSSAPRHGPVAAPSSPRKRWSNAPSSRRSVRGLMRCAKCSPSVSPTARPVQGRFFSMRMKLPMGQWSLPSAEL